MSGFEPALAVANSVLYEGYLLYPYTASAIKNRYRWQFGVVVPLEYTAAGTGETALQQTEVLLEPDGDPLVDVRFRFLHVETRRVEAARGDGFVPVDSLEVDGTPHLSFEEAVEREANLHVRPLHEARTLVPLAFEGSERSEPLRDAQDVVRGRIVRRRWPLHGTCEVTCEPAREGGLTKMRLRLENHSQVVAAEARAAVLRTAFVSAHALLAVEHGRFLSALDPPDYAREATAQLENRHVWPVLAGASSRDEHGAALVLASPIILYDFPAVAKRSERDAFDGTEIEELLRLSVLGLSDAERSEARATDPRARAIVDWAERLGPEHIEALHDGALERCDPAPFAPSGDPLTALDVPALDCVFIGSTKVMKGSAVRLHPSRRADVWDTFLKGKLATVCAIHQDVENQFYVAVTVDDDPASDLHEWYGRSFFFYPDEVEPLPAREPA